MARKLKTYTTSAGFFDLAVAAASMKAALEAWGSKRNLFHDGLARESGDPAIVRATMARPGVVLRRAVGTSAPFGERAELPTKLGGAEARQPGKRGGGKRQPAARPVDGKAARQAALTPEREQRQRERQARREEADQERKRARYARRCGRRSLAERSQAEARRKG
jgi:hypothetical protein